MIHSRAVALTVPTLTTGTHHVTSINNIRDRIRTTCRVRSKTVVFRRMGCRFEVGVSGWLVGVYDTPAQAVFAAAERVRQQTGYTYRTPTIPARTRRLLDEMSRGAA